MDRANAILMTILLQKLGGKVVITEQEFLNGQDAFIKGVLVKTLDKEKDVVIIELKEGK